MDLCRISGAVAGIVAKGSVGSGLSSSIAPSPKLWLGATSELMVQIQATIDAIDEAMKDEERLTPPSREIGIKVAPSGRRDVDDDPEPGPTSINTL
jgi:hypothetical protein